MSLRRRLLLAMAGLCSLAAMGPASAGEQPPPPAGFPLVSAANAAGTFLRPDGWSTKEETRDGTQAFFITKTPLADGARFDVGFTVNAFDHVSRTGTAPSAWARAMVARLASGRQVIKSGVVKGNAVDMNLLDVVDTAGGPPVVIHYRAMGDDAKDRAWLLIFEAPQSEWDANVAIAHTMLDAFGL